MAKTKQELNRQYTHRDICLNCKTQCRANSTGWCQSCRTVGCDAEGCTEMVMLMRIPDKRTLTFCRTHHSRGKSKKVKPVVYL